MPGERAMLGKEALQRSNPQDQGNGEEKNQCITIWQSIGRRQYKGARQCRGKR